MLLQAGTIPDPSTITDGNSALIWVVGFLVAVIVAMGFTLKAFLKSQETQYEARIADLKAALVDEEREKKAAQDEVKKINEKVIEQMVPTMKDLNTALGKVIEMTK